MDIYSFYYQIIPMIIANVCVTLNSLVLVSLYLIEHQLCGRIRKENNNQYFIFLYLLYMEKLIKFFEKNFLIIIFVFILYKNFSLKENFTVTLSNDQRKCLQQNCGFEDAVIASNCYFDLIQDETELGKIYNSVCNPSYDAKIGKYCNGKNWRTSYNAAQDRDPKTYTLDGCKALCDVTNGCKGIVHRKDKYNRGYSDDKSCVLCSGDFEWGNDEETSDGYEKTN